MPALVAFSSANPIVSLSITIRVNAPPVCGEPEASVGKVFALTKKAQYKKAMSLLLLAANIVTVPLADDPPADPIVITAERSPSRVMPPGVEIGDEQLLKLQPTSAANAIAQLPGVSVRTNSRGETIARVRGSEERQTQVFVDGAPLAVPWDGRADVGVIPAGLIGTVRASKGAVPMEYGTNTVAGAIDLQTHSGEGQNIRAAASAGTMGFASGSAVVRHTGPDVGLTIAAAGLTRDAEPVASLSVLPFNQPRRQRRLNTDLSSLSLFGAASHQQGRVLLRSSLLHFQVERGIAPESDRDPTQNAPRYWRYPHIRQTQLTLGSNIDLSDATSLRLVAWRQWFDQTITQYSDATYSTKRAREEDEDDTFGARLVLSSKAGAIDFRVAANAQTSRHSQVDTQLPSGPKGPELIFRQNLYTIGGEADVPVGSDRATFGLAYDHSTNPLTGDKPAQSKSGALALSAAYRTPIGEHWTLTFSGGRRNRFPSSRELFGEALGRFLPNPDLKAEQAWLGDVEFRYERGRVSAVINPFFARVEDTIAQRVIAVDGRNRRQRYNLSGSTSYGLDATVRSRVTDVMALELDGTLLRARAGEATTPFRRLLQRPSYEVAAAVDLDPTDRLFLRAEFRRVGPAVDLDANGNKARLAPGNEINLRSRWHVAQLGGGARLFLTGAVDNLADDVITPQLGLPLPGRTFRMGFQIY